MNYLKDTILFYHAGCPDGFGSAYAFWKKYGDSIDYFAISHEDELPDVTGKKVFFADIAMSREVTLLAAKQAKEITILDHHISAYEKLKDLPYYIYSDKRSGAGMSWEYCHPGVKTSEIVKYVEDRDIWKWEYPESKEILSVVDAAGFTFEAWDDISKELENNKNAVVIKGSAILKYCETTMNRIKKGSHTLNIKGYEVPAINTPFFRSEILMELCLDAPFSAGYHYDGEAFRFSLRSVSEGADVSKIAGLFGGGGHKNASGFSICSLEELK